MTLCRSFLLLLCITSTSIQTSMVPLYLSNATDINLAVLLPAIKLQRIVPSHTASKLTDICFENTNYAITIKDLASGITYTGTITIPPKSPRGATIIIRSKNNALTIHIESKRHIIQW